MGLKQSIVVVSEFTLPTRDGKGTRGGTPGEYVYRYMARDNAIENIAPTRLTDAEGVLSRFQERNAASIEEQSVPSMKRRMKKSQKQGGVAFSNTDTALSDDELRCQSDAIQEQFNNGHTAIKTILSFTEEYLRENNVLDPDFEYENRGDFAGHVDQLKLRMAIQHGMQKMSRSFDDLRYVGVIQVDTGHVHCHLCMCDFGRGTIMDDGRQKGKLTARQMTNLRRGIDMFLDSKQLVKMMSSSVMHDRRNAVCYIKKFTHRALTQQGLPQFLISCLPDNKNYWNASTKRKDMRKANAIVRDFVLDMLQPEGKSVSPYYRDAHDSIVKYANTRQKREGITEQERMKLIRDGEEKMLKDCMNAVYSVLKKIPKEQLVVRTPMLSTMSMDYEEMASQAVNDPMMEFGFKLRSYSNRLAYHRKQYHKFRAEAKAYEDAEDKSEESKALGEYLQYERDYQQRLMVKYQHFLSFMPPDDSLQLEFDDIMAQKKRLAKFDAMTADPAFDNMSPAEADEYGMRIYGISKGSYIKSLPDLWKNRVEHVKERYDVSVSEFRSKLQDYGFDFNGEKVTKDKLFPFDDVKALDLHHLGYDFPYDVRISKANADMFIKYAKNRAGKYDKAVDYLQSTGQADKVSVLPQKDVRVMRKFASELEKASPELKSARGGGGQYRRSATIRLGKDYTVDLQSAVEKAAKSAAELTD